MNSPQTWENKVLQICRERLGQAEFEKRLEKASQACNRSHLAGKALLSKACSDAKKIVNCKAARDNLLRHHAVGAAGYAVVIKNEQIPSNEFFEPGRRFRVRFRHSNIGNDDDAGSSIREAAIKFADKDEEGPLDLVMTTGRTALSRNGHSLLKTLKFNHSEQVHNLCNEDPQYYFSLVDGLRRGPTSYSNLSYYTQFAYQFTPKDGKPRVVRFRLMPRGENQMPETGLLSEKEQQAPWMTSRLEEDERHQCYLRNEFIEKLHQDEPVKYLLQMQIAGENQQAVWNPNLLWSEQESPWLDVIMIELTTFLPFHTLSRTYFNIVEKPKCLEFLSSVSPKDYFSYQKLWSEIYTKFETKHISQIEKVKEHEGDSQQYKQKLESYYVTVSAAPIKEREVPRVDITITLIGTDCRTAPIDLDEQVDERKAMQCARRASLNTQATTSGTATSTAFTNIFGGECQTFAIRAENVGIILALFLTVQHRQLTEDWYLRSMIVTCPGGHQVQFPCHRIVLSDVVLQTGEVYLKHKQMHEVHRQERLFELCARRHMYSWMSSPRCRSSSSTTTTSCTTGTGCNPSTSDSCIEATPSITASNASLTNINAEIKVPPPCGMIRARCLQQLPKGDRILADHYTGLRWETTTTGSASRGVLMRGMAEKGTHDARRMTTIREFSIVRSPSPAPPEEAERKSKAFNRWMKVKESIKYLSDASNIHIPDGSKGEMCRSVRNDIEFGRFFLAGPNPTMIRICRKIPDNFPVTQDLVEGLLDYTRRLDLEAKNGRVYLVDYSILRGIPTIHRDADHRYMVAPLVLLYVRASGDLMPLAIQLSQDPGLDNPIWTPRDRLENWILAKLWVRCADFQIQFAVSHLFKCHWMMEPFMLAMMRQLPSAHPVYKLLKLHFRYTLITNTLLRSKVMGKGCSVDKFTSLGVSGFRILVAEYLRKQFTFDEMYPPRDFATRGVADVKLLPKYYYRDDALRSWNAMLKYCRDILGLYYANDKDVVDDDEAQAWIRGIHDCGFPEFNEQQRRGLPRKFSTINELAEVVTMVMFTLTCGHSATHTDALDLYGFIPDVPAMMRRPPPTRREKMITREFLTSTLIDQFPDAYYGSLAFVMLVYLPDEVDDVLSNHNEVYFVEREALKIIENFKASLAKINEIIRHRNLMVGVLYENLLPEVVPISAEPIPYIPRAALKKALLLCPHTTRQLLFGRPKDIAEIMPCISSLPTCTQFARTLGGRSFLARRLVPTSGTEIVNMFRRGLRSNSRVAFALSGVMESDNDDVTDGATSSASGTPSHSRHSERGRLRSQTSTEDVIDEHAPGTSGARNDFMRSRINSAL